MSKKEMTTEKRLKVRLYLSLLVYTVVGYGLTLILDYIFSKFDNGIFAWLYWRLDLLFILYLMIGFVCIFNYYWKKPWGYLDEVIDATQTVYEQNSHTVSLSDPLKELEAQLNQIKMSVLLSKRAAKQAEEKKNEIIMYLAHDIRTPLTTVIGYLSLLHEAPDMPEQQKEKYVKVALNKAERLEKLINELFEITKYNAHTVITETKNSINYDLVDKMPKNGLLVNTARKEVINEADLLRLMNDRPDLEYVTDIMPVHHAEFADHFPGRYFSTPKKMGAQTAEANINAGIAAARQIVGFLKDGCEKFRVNK